MEIQKGDTLKVKYYEKTLWGQPIKGEIKREEEVTVKTIFRNGKIKVTTNGCWSIGYTITPEFIDIYGEIEKIS